MGLFVEVLPVRLTQWFSSPIKRQFFVGPITMRDSERASFIAGEGGSLLVTQKAMFNPTRGLRFAWKCWPELVVLLRGVVSVNLKHQKLSIFPVSPLDSWPNGMPRGQFEQRILHVFRRLDLNPKPLTTNSTDPKTNPQLPKIGPNLLNF